ncbi:hypothetical protein DSL72_007228 [Monilinia vaccinii-corymbosi]|uniref:Uncharacterized protein n=1 Tax=Monilinia vaccinii-corymbosi TaxID=61207 RepID=A0A8A3PM78_9HELO|nr:hypothetical protein DSL72_007228 [Monilinia vaccinii-corymbosi]
MVEKLIEAIFTRVVEKENPPWGTTWQDKKNLLGSQFPDFTDQELEQHKIQILKSFTEIRKRQRDQEEAMERRELEEELQRSPPNLDQTNVHSAASYDNSGRTPPESPELQELAIPESQPEVDDTIDGAGFRFGRLPESYVRSSWLESTGIEAADKQIRLQWFLKSNDKQPERHLNTNFTIMSDEMLASDIMLGSKCQDPRYNKESDHSKGTSSAASDQGLIESLNTLSQTKMPFRPLLSSSGIDTDLATELIYKSAKRSKEDQEYSSKGQEERSPKRRRIEEL